MSRSQTPDLDRLEREERGETATHQRRRRLTNEQVQELSERMGTEVGRRGVARQLDDSGLYADPFSANASVTANKLGERRAAVELREDVRLHCPREWLLMEKEQLDRERQLRAEIEREELR